MREIKQCRLCDSPVKTVLTLGSTPLANDYSDKPDLYATKYPLELTQCTNCGHVQQRYLIDNLFEDYKYTTPKTVARYLTPVAKLLRKRFPEAKTVFEIGSNNGTYLKVLNEQGFEACGIDPSAIGENNIRAYFSEAWAKGAKQFDLILANNVLAHIDNLNDVFRGIVRMMKDDGALVFEVQYLSDLVKCGAFDMIYHEHMSYHNVSPLKPFLRKFGLVMTRVDHVNNHGGSIRITARKQGNEIIGWNDYPPDWEIFKSKIETIKKNLRDKLAGIKVIGFGAAAKATTLIHYCDIQENIDFCVDDTPEKQKHYIPGTSIQILPTKFLMNGETILMFAWNYEKEIHEMFPDSKLIHPFK